MTILRNRLLARVSAPASEPLTLSEAKLYLRIDHDQEDILINDLIIAARMMAEHWLKRSLITQTWKISYDEYLPEEVTLLMGPVNSITSVVIVGRDGGTQTIDSGIYYLNAAKDKLIVDSVIVGFRIEITYVTGYGNSAAIPKPIKQGMLSHISCMYDSRGEYTDSSLLPEQAIKFYMPFREICL